jgi:hypothetical protein
MGIKLNFTSPAHLAISGTAALTTWAATGYSTDPKHLGAVVLAATAGAASESKNPSSPNVPADSHIITPYVNNINPEV